MVVIIDEYDAPLLDVVHEKDNLQQLRFIMQNFYSPIKMLDPYLEFFFITGMTRFVSISGELNNLCDISMFDQYSAICGISKDELTTVMQPHVEGLGKTLGMTYEECLEELTSYYDGYHFSGKSEDVFNPFSLIKALDEQKIGAYWFESDTPSYLIEALRKYNVNVLDMEQEYCDETDFYRPLDMITFALPLLYQVGCLTIKNYDSQFRCYHLDYPNMEVKMRMQELGRPQAD